MGRRVMEVALGNESADILIANGKVVDVLTGELSLRRELSQA